LYAGRWITADASFGQLPADVTHIRFARGGMNSAFDLLPIIGKLHLQVLDYAPASNPDES